VVRGTDNCFRVGDLPGQSEFDESSGRRKVRSDGIREVRKATRGTIEQSHFHRV
jgi:hypothetical protein